MDNQRIKDAQRHAVAKEWEKAGCAYYDAAEKETIPYVKACHFAKAADMFVRNNEKHRAILVYEEAIRIFTDEGKFATAAKHLTTSGTLSAEIGDKTGAIKQLEKAVDHYMLDNSTATASVIKRQIIDLLVSHGEYEKSALLCEEIVSLYKDYPLCQFQIPNYWFCGFLCRLVQKDLMRAQSMLAEGMSKFDDANGKNLINFAGPLLNLCHAWDKDKFLELVDDFQSKRSLNATEKTLLDAIRQD